MPKNKNLERDKYFSMALYGAKTFKFITKVVRILYCSQEVVFVKMEHIEIG